MAEARGMDAVLEVAGRFLAEKLDDHGAAAGFGPVGVRFRVSGTRNMGRLELREAGPQELRADAPQKLLENSPQEHREDGHREIRLTLGVFRDGTDRLYSNLLHSAGPEKMGLYLRSPEARRAWQEQIDHLCRRADEYWD